MVANGVVMLTAGGVALTGSGLAGHRDRSRDRRPVRLVLGLWTMIPAWAAMLLGLLTAWGRPEAAVTAGGDDGRRYHGPVKDCCGIVADVRARQRRVLRIVLGGATHHLGRLAGATGERAAAPCGAPARGWGDLGLGMMVMMLVFWGLVTAGVVLAIRWLAGQGGGPRADRALDILRERYAQGEIDRDESEAKQRDLRIH
jgi:putative membrane protein